MKAEVNLLKYNCPNCKMQFPKVLPSCWNCGVVFVEHYL